MQISSREMFVVKQLWVVLSLSDYDVPVILGFATLKSPFAHLLETLRSEVNPSISHLIHQLGMKHGSQKYTVFILTPTACIRLSLSHYLGHHALPPTWEPTPFVETNVILQRTRERD